MEGDMDITVQKAEGKVPVTVLQLTGDLDGASYQSLIAAGKKLNEAGVRNILVDLSGVPYMSSAGLVALHTVALILQGKAQDEDESAAEAMRSIRRDLDRGYNHHLKLLNPTPRVDKVLDMSGFKGMIEVFTDRDKAMSSFT
jgi:anti-anti-sigma factor